jgi:superfamily II DNA helicase RecQ
LHAENRLHYEQLITEVAQGVYRLVLLGPEFCVPGNQYWMGLTKDCVFRRRLLGIVIDEAHLCHAWRDFRPRIDGLFRLNSWFNVPFMVMSATMTPYVRQYVHSSLRLPGNVPLIHCPVDRPEIYLSVRTIQYSIATFKDLDFLLPSSISQWDVVPTIVFADSQMEFVRSLLGQSATRLVSSISKKNARVGSE